ncbi:MAG: hypothetical protein K9G12_05125 [Candidatus Nanopelagicales bacterium]|nr:hypothetical protein [Candidatus Nanopelagicales bacterium]MCF8539642.1 hypothetical protein [Candidatus Nanopelagicales bacterium]
MSRHIALATCNELPDLDPDDQPLIRQFAEAGVTATPAIWSDQTVDWDQFDQVIVRNTWDYTDHLPTFLEWVNSRQSCIRNSAELITWNTNKTYLRDVSAAGIPVIDTQFISQSSDEWDIPLSGDYVVKPSVSAGSRDTLRLSSTDPQSRGVAQELLDTIVASGKSGMIQPYLDLVDTDGETALLYIGGEFSHAIRKGPLLRPDSAPERVHGLYLQEEITPRTPRTDQREVADRVMDYLTSRFGTPLYARIDLIDSHVGQQPLVLEIEVVEPSLFFHTSPSSLARFVEVSLS